MSTATAPRSRKALLAASLASAAVAATILGSANPAAAATSHNLMLRVPAGVTHVQIVPFNGGRNSCVSVTSGRYRDTHYQVVEGNQYTFQAMRYEFPGAGGPCGGGSRYVGNVGPVTIKHVTTTNYWFDMRL